MNRYEELKAQIAQLRAAGWISGRPTDEELADYAYGMAVLASPDVTRQMATEAVTRLPRLKFRVT